jgi:hypothetical protein
MIEILSRLEAIEHCLARLYPCYPYDIPQSQWDETRKSAEAARQEAMMPLNPAPAKPQLPQEEWDAACERFRVRMDR